MKQRVPVAVYVQKRKSTMGECPLGQDDDVATTSAQVEVRMDTCPTQPSNLAGGNVAISSATQRSYTSPEPLLNNITDSTNKGKEIIVYNPFAVLESEGGESEEDRVQRTSLQYTGPKQRSPADPPP
ncbi:UNVERIFIED_CONTAM: hypothetical protein Slati_4244200 [Sesamum latifolium]|uniref:Uncharacterized protein n=1 Tax=Sesamum latifolium TaxID=2727402 RepID=A0AAW2TC61_9LAMI